MTGRGIKLFIDEMINPELARTLQQRGYDAISCLDVGGANRKISDDEQIRFATEQGRAILTDNALDFIACASRVHRNGMRQGVNMRESSSASKCHSACCSGGWCIISLPLIRRPNTIHCCTWHLDLLSREQWRAILSRGETKETESDVGMIEQEQEQRTRAVNIPHIWGWFALTIIACVLAAFTFVHPIILPKSIVIGMAVFCILWWLLGGLFYRVRFAKALKGRKRSGLRVGGWALDGWQARHARHGSYWRAMRSWVR